MHGRSRDGEPVYPDKFVELTDMPNPYVSEMCLGRCPGCRRSIVLRLWAIVIRRGTKYAVQAHNCVNCWRQTSFYAEPI